MMLLAVGLAAGAGGFLLGLLAAGLAVASGRGGAAPVDMVGRGFRPRDMPSGGTRSGAGQARALTGVVQPRPGIPWDTEPGAAERFADRARQPRPPEIPPDRC